MKELFGMCGIILIKSDENSSNFKRLHRGVGGFYSGLVGLPKTRGGVGARDGYDNSMIREPTPPECDFERSLRQ